MNSDQINGSQLSTNTFFRERMTLRMNFANEQMNAYKNKEKTNTTHCSQTCTNSNVQTLLIRLYHLQLQF